MTHQHVDIVSRDLTASLDQLNYISQMLLELAKMVPASAGERLPELMKETHLELTQTAARLLNEHLNELGKRMKQSKNGLKKRAR